MPAVTGDEWVNAWVVALQEGISMHNSSGAGAGAYTCAVLLGWQGHEGSLGGAWAAIRASR